MIHQQHKSEPASVFPSRGPNHERKAELGQFFTSQSIAAFMASLFSAGRGASCRLLDPGAGAGVLTRAFLDRWREGSFGFETVSVDAVEIDPELCSHLVESLGPYAAYPRCDIKVIEGDFVELASDWVAPGLFAKGPQYTHAILNPPYKKIRSDSEHRALLRRTGIETVNLYSAFVALSLELVVQTGEVVAIIPRSFCNGPYFRPFREFILDRAALRRIHLFESRTKPFGDDDVLQENVIIVLERGGRAGPVTISSSTDASFHDLIALEIPFERVVLPDDRERFIHIPTTPKLHALESNPAVRYSLSELGLVVSTGPVVDFRMKEHLLAMPTPTSVPLLYPAHFSQGSVTWPLQAAKKPNAIERGPATDKWLYPNGYYCVVRRFSSKEERRRIVASVVAPEMFPGAQWLGFENHLNVFHTRRSGLTEFLAHGLTLFLNTSAVDSAFRRFSGHTQVNAADLKKILYPSREKLTELGKWGVSRRRLPQAEIDAAFEAIVG